MSDFRPVVDREMDSLPPSVFEGIGVPDAENMKACAELIVEIRSILQENRRKQTEAAKHFGVSRPRLNDTLRGRRENITIDRVINMLAAVGRHVRVVVDRAA